MIDIKKTIDVLRAEYPGSGIALQFADNWQLMVAVILSAQCTDARVNMVTPPLFERWPGVEDFAGCNIEDLEKMIFSTGFYKNKARSIRGAAEMVVGDFGGKVPSRMEELLRLPGVARKTANVILSSGFGVNEGIVVDTHVIRLSGLLGLVPQKDVEVKNAVRIERKLMEIVPRKDWGIFPHLLMSHGRKVCIARRPQCGECVLKKVCPSAKLSR